jgi:hypothetical protein
MHLKGQHQVPCVVLSHLLSLCRADTDLRVDYYCSKWAWDAPCKPFSKESIANFKDASRKVCLCICPVTRALKVTQEKTLVCRTCVRS